MFLEKSHDDFPIDWILGMKTGLKDDSKFLFIVSKRTVII